MNKFGEYTILDLLVQEKTYNEKPYNALWLILDDYKRIKVNRTQLYALAYLCGFNVYQNNLKDDLKGKKIKIYYQRNEDGTINFNKINFINPIDEDK